MKKPKILEKVKKKATGEKVKHLHNSFKLTKRRDFKKPLKLPNVFRFTKEVRKVVWKNKKIFIKLMLFYLVATILMVGLTSEDTYQTLSETLSSAGGDLFSGFWGSMTKSGMLFLTALSGGISDSLTDVQELYAGIITLITLLTAIWLFRNALADRKVKLRDGLYNACSPIISVFAIIIVMLLQLIPFAIVLIGYSAAVSTDLLSGGVEAMLFWIAACLLSFLSLYWLIGSFFALIIVTIPGVYPMVALRSANELIVSRRMKIFFRILWLALTLVLIWFVVLFPTILLDAWVKSMWSWISWLPLVPFMILLLTAFSLIWFSSYTYLLYRKVVDGESEAN